jgi:hypothetical protein
MGKVFYTRGDLEKGQRWVSDAEYDEILQEDKLNREKEEEERRAEEKKQEVRNPHLPQYDPEDPIVELDFPPEDMLEMRVLAPSPVMDTEDDIPSPELLMEDEAAPAEEEQLDWNSESGDRDVDMDKDDQRT